MILGDLVTSIGAGAKEGIVGWISARKEEEGEGKRGRIVSGTMNPRYYFLSQPMYLSNKYGTHPFLTSQINQPTRFALLYHPHTRLVSNDEFPAGSGSSGSGRGATVGGSTFIPEIGGDGDSGERGDNLGRGGDAIEIRDVRRG